MGFNLKGVLGTVAPWIATAVGGPMAGQAVRSITGALGLKEDAKIDDVQAALEAGRLTGEQLVALKAADQAFQEQMQAAGFKHLEDLEGLAQQDRASARAREIAVKDNTPKWLAAGVTAGFFGILAFMLMRPIPAETHDVLMVMIGSLGTAWTAVIAYYFGSSAGSDKKTELMAASSQLSETNRSAEATQSKLDDKK